VCVARGGDMWLNKDPVGPTSHVKYNHNKIRLDKNMSGEWGGFLNGNIYQEEVHKPLMEM